MSHRTATANGNDPVQRNAAADAHAVHDGVIFTAIVGCIYWP